MGRHRHRRDGILGGSRLTNPAHRKGFIFWQVLGLADLVNALALGTLAGVIDPHGIPTAAMTVLPMSYIPTYAVPLFLILHIICIAQARRWRNREFRKSDVVQTYPLEAKRS
jgi:membrane protein implicated in regulation of membrane protease activity